MPYLERNVNFILLFAIVVIIVGFVAGTIYFQKSLKETNDKYNTENQRLSLARAQLQEALNTLSNLNKTATTTAKDLNESVSDFNQKYTNVTGEKQKVQQTLEQTKQELSITKNTLQNTKNDLEVTEVELVSAQTELDDTKTSLQNANAKIDYMKSDAKSGESSATDTITKIGGYLDSQPECSAQLQTLMYDVRRLRTTFSGIQTK